MLYGPPTRPLVKPSEKERTHHTVAIKHYFIHNNVGRYLYTYERYIIFFFDILIYYHHTRWDINVIVYLALFVRGFFLLLFV